MVFFFNNKLIGLPSFKKMPKQMIRANESQTQITTLFNICTIMLNDMNILAPI